MKKLTQKQIEMLDAIHAGYFQGNVPTVYELADRFHIKTSTIFAHLRALQRKGQITRSGKARSLEPAGAHRLIGSQNGKITMAIIVRDDQDCEPLIRLMQDQGCTVRDTAGGVWQPTAPVPEKSTAISSSNQLTDSLPEAVNAVLQGLANLNKILSGPSSPGNADKLPAVNHKTSDQTRSKQ